MSRTARATWNVITSLGLTVVSLGAGFVATPLLLRHLGQERLGAFRAALDWTGYVALAEFGISGALLTVFAHAARDPAAGGDELRAAASAGYHAMRRVALVMLVASLVLLAGIHWLVPVSPELVGDLRLGLAIGIVGLALAPLAPLRAVLEATQHGYATNFALTLQSFTITLTSVVLAMAGLGIAGQFGAIVVGSVVMYVMLAWHVARRFPGIVSLSLRPQAAATPAVGAAAKSLRRLNVPTFVMQLCGRVGLLTDNIIIASLLSPAAVVPFFITQRLASLVQGQLNVIGGATWAGMAELYNGGHQQLFRDRLLELSQLIAVLGLAVLIPVVIFNRTFVGLWVGTDQFAGYALTALSATNGLMLAMISLWGWMFAGTGHTPLLVRPLVVGTAVNVVVSLVATKTLGMIGPVLGTAAGIVLVQAWWIPLLLRRQFGLSLRRLAGAVLPAAALAVPYIAGVAEFDHHFPAAGWFGLLSRMALGGGGYLLLASFVVLDRPTRVRYIKRVQQMLTRRGATA